MWAHVEEILSRAKASVKNDCFTPDIWFPPCALVSVKCLFYFSESDPLMCALVSVKFWVFPTKKRKRRLSSEIGGAKGEGGLGDLRLEVKGEWMLQSGQNGERGGDCQISWVCYIIESHLCSKFKLRIANNFQPFYTYFHTPRVPLAYSVTRQGTDSPQ